MAILDSESFYRQIADGQIAPIYLLFGEEPYLLRQAMLLVQTAVVVPETKDFNFDQFFAGDVKISAVRESVEMLPMMATRRMVILREAHELSDSEWETLDPVIERPVDGTVFLITANRVDKRKKTIKKLLDKAVSVEFKKPYDNQIPSWIVYMARQKGLEIQSDACLLMHKLVGSHLIEIDSELEKLADFIGSQRNTIELRDVMSVVSRSKEENIFELTRAIGHQDRVRSLEYLVRLLDQGQSEIGVIALVLRHVRLLLTIKQGLAMGLFGAKLASHAQLPPYFLDQYLEQARLWSVKKLEGTLLVLAETDRALRSSPLSAHIWLENMILKVCTLEEPKAGSIFSI